MDFKVKEIVKIACLGAMMVCNHYVFLIRDDKSLLQEEMITFKILFL